MTVLDHFELLFNEVKFHWHYSTLTLTAEFINFIYLYYYYIIIIIIIIFRSLLCCFSVMNFTYCIIIISHYVILLLSRAHFALAS